MFNFIFENTKIVDILAPVSNPNQQLFLAIQHHRQQEVQNLLGTIGPNALSGGDSGYGAIHIACRYNNRFALDLLLNSGATVDSQDRTGNIGLHYAAKNGHLEMCKFLIERGSNILKRNSDGKTAYDVTENHLIRQFLLPLQLTAERVHFESTGGVGAPSHMGGYTHGGGVPNNAAYTHAPPPPPPTVSYAPPPPAYGMSYAPPAPAPPQPSSAGFTPPPGPHYAPPPIATSHPQQPDVQTHTFPPGPPPAPSPSPAVSVSAAPVRAVSNERRIMPDGFHSSASDPVLQRKYGHIKETVNIAPPPTGALMHAPAPAPTSTSTSTPPAAYSAYGSPQPIGPPPSVFSRYVAYDAHTNSASTAASPPPPPPAPVHAPSPVHNNAQPTPPPALGTPVAAPPAPAAAPVGSTVGSSPLVEVNLMSPPAPLLAPVGSSLGLRPPADVGIGSGRPLVNINTISAAHDHVISADSTSSAIL